jgi:hypothetical protein
MRSVVSGVPAHLGAWPSIPGRGSSASSAYVRHGKEMRGPPKRRSVLTVPEFDWVCDCLQQWIEDVRPRYAPARSTDLWPSERGGMIAG